MANTEDNLPMSLSVSEEVTSAESVAKPVETDQDESEQAVPGNSIAVNEEKLNIEISERMWATFFENMLKISNVVNAEPMQIEPDVIGSKCAGESENAESAKTSALKRVVADPLEFESKRAKSEDIEIPITRRPRIEVVRFPEEPFTFVAEWTWDLIVDNCALCCNDINYLCVECQAGECNEPESESNLICICNVSQGTCKHVFHTHCILRWLIRRPVCPLCGDFWMTIESCS